MRTGLIGLLLLLFSVPAAFAQTSTWEAVLYVEARTDQGLPVSGEFVVVTPDGVITRYPVPSIFYVDRGATRDVVISPDRRYAAFQSSSLETGLPEITLVNLTLGDCCMSVDAPIDDLDSYEFGSFSPDGTRLAVSYIGNPTPEQYFPDGGLMAVDAATGNITANISIVEAQAFGTPNWFQFAQARDWKPDGIHFIPNCYGCEGVPQSPMFVWEPHTNQVVQSPTEYYIAGAERLEATGEVIVSTHNAQYPFTDDGSGFGPPSNVVEWYANGLPPSPEARAANGEPVVYFDPASAAMPRSKWIVDGQAFLLWPNQEFPQAVAVFRDGTRQVVAVESGDSFLTGTPDGFLATADGAIIHYRFDTGSFDRTLVEQFDQAVRLVDAPAMGSSVRQGFSLMGEGDFGPQVEPVENGDACPGFLPSRLTVNGVGRVTPGAANNLRAEPSLDAERTGSIPGGAAFMVISGPECDEGASIAWWEVNYDGVIGWTAEGQGDTYWVEPG